MARGSAAEYRDQVVEISRLAVNASTLDGITFVNCQIVGPAVLLPLEDVNIVGCTWDVPSVDSLIWVIPRAREHVVGAIGLLRCTFSACTFRDVGLGVLEDQVEGTRSSFET